MASRGTSQSRERSARDVYNWQESYDIVFALSERRRREVSRVKETEGSLIHVVEKNEPV